MTRRELRHALLVLGYALVFYGALPALLVWVGRAIDRAAGWSAAPAPWALALLLPAALLHATALGTLWWKGGGAPITAEPPPRFTGGGLYRVVRHPIYFTYNLLIPPAGLLLASPGLALPVALCFAPCWMLYAHVEERFLLRRFGETYAAYQRQVGMLPGLRRRTG